MITLHETITVDRTRSEAFNYISDFRTTTEWDATAIRARVMPTWFFISTKEKSH